jgi:DNA-binding MarR family transcriptional regulator
VSDSLDELDEVVHQRTRLGILAVLAEADRAQFSFLKETLGLSDGNLSRHLMILEEAGLVRIDKGYEGKRPRTWASITASGKRAFRTEIAALKRLVARFESTNEATEEVRPSGEVVIRAAPAGQSMRPANS